MRVLPVERGPVALEGATIDLARWGDGARHVVLLHDGLGSIDQFKDFPATLAAATGSTVYAYDRPGHGVSTPVPHGPWPADWLHREAARLAELLRHVGIDRPVLVGHSDGGSIALLHAIEQADQVSGVVALAAHSFVEDVCVAQIASMRTEAPRWVDGLSRFHLEAGAVFEAWSGVWVSEDFSTWDIRRSLRSIVAPTLIVQGEQDEYATETMATATAAAIGANARCDIIEEAGHLLPRQVPERITEMVMSLLVIDSGS